jgi:hypothetical protein
MAEERAMRWRTPGKRIGREARRAEMELYTRPRPARRIVRRAIRRTEGRESAVENPAQSKNVGNMV